jgi:hypothetical protein
VAFGLQTTEVLVAFVEGLDWTAGHIERRGVG